MNEEELKLLNKLDDLPNKLNLEIRGLILAEVMLRKENQKLKKQLEEYIRAEFKAKDELEKQRQEYQDVYKDVRIEIKSYKNQQKEFIEWLENESKELIRDAGYHQRICLEILDKYKEIIGGDNK